MATHISLERWWAGMKPEQRRQWLQLQAGDTVPAQLYPLLFGSFDARVSDVDPPAMAPTTVDPHLDAFLSGKRRESAQDGTSSPATS